MFKTIKNDIDAVFARDPAVRTRSEVIFCYPGFHAILIYRLSRWVWQRDWLLLGRFLSHCGRLLTGIEIHPGAQIGDGLFIDHGLGVVIGETAKIGKNVTLYHDVTLGGIAPDKNPISQKQQKRHPTISDDVVVGSGAQILGPILVGKCARIGANTVVLKDVPDFATVVGNPGRITARSKEKDSERFTAYGTPSKGFPDPISRAVDNLMKHISNLETRVKEIEDSAKVTPESTGENRLASGQKKNPSKPH